MNCVENNVEISDLNDIKQKQIVELKKNLDENGYVVIPKVLSDEICDKYVEETVDWMCNLLPLDKNDQKTWKTENMPSGPRFGMYQSIVSHCPVAWKLREFTYPLFCSLYDTKELITSIDGASIMPPVKHRTTKDWPHIDQTISEENMVCYQGQVVLTDTTASFRCTPKSHLKHQEIVNRFEIDKKNPWHKFTSEQEKELESEFNDWQIPIHVKKGSIILWRSTTIHSAQRVEDHTIYEKEKKNGLWDGWRCTFYICQRPKKDFTKRGLTTVKKAYENGRTTNHWGTKTFPKTTRWDSNKDSRVLDLLKNPEKLVDKNISLTCKKLVGIL